MRRLRPEGCAGGTGTVTGNRGRRSASFTPGRPRLPVAQRCLSQQPHADKQQDKSSGESEKRKLMRAFLQPFLNAWISNFFFFFFVK